MAYHLNPFSKKKRKEELISARDRQVLTYFLRTSYKLSWLSFSDHGSWMLLFCVWTVKVVGGEECKREQDFSKIKHGFKEKDDE